MGGLCGHTFWVPLWGAIFGRKFGRKFWTQFLETFLGRIYETDFSGENCWRPRWTHGASRPDPSTRSHPQGVAKQAKAPLASPGLDSGALVPPAPILAPWHPGPDAGPPAPRANDIRRTPTPGPNATPGITRRSRAHEATVAQSENPEPHRRKTRNLGQRTTRTNPTASHPAARLCDVILLFLSCTYLARLQKPL